MKKIIKITILFIIFSTICFFVSNSVYAMDLQKNMNKDLRYNYFDNGFDKATENIISDIESAKIDGSESFQKNNGNSTVISTWESVIKGSSYYKIANWIMSDDNLQYTIDRETKHYTLEQYAETFPNRTYKEIYKTYGIDFEKKDSNAKIDYSKVKKVYNEIYPLITKISGSLEKEQETNDMIGELENPEKGEEKKKELQDYTWIEVMDNKDKAHSLIENGYKSIVEKWLETLEDKDSELIWNADGSNYTKQDLRAAITDFETMLEENEESNHIYKLPLKNTTTSSEASIEDVINDGDAFINAGNEEGIYNDNDLQNFSKTIYNILLAAGIFIATATGGVLGIKMMTSSVEEQAEVKKLLIPYVVGCVVIFGGFGIWKLVITILQTI